MKSIDSADEKEDDVRQREKIIEDHFMPELNLFRIDRILQALSE